MLPKNNKKKNIRHWFSFKLKVSVPEHYALHDLLTSMNMFRKQPLWSVVRPRQSVRADRVIQKLSHLHSNASLPILPLSLPRSRARLPSLGPVVKVTQHAPRWRADRRAGRAGGGRGGLALPLLRRGHRVQARRWASGGCRLRQDSREASS